jgi:hypothetical protein
MNPHVGLGHFHSSEKFKYTTRQNEERLLKKGEILFGKVQKQQ